jgi:hypothetical protein
MISTSPDAVLCSRPNSGRFISNCMWALPFQCIVKESILASPLFMITSSAAVGTIRFSLPLQWIVANLTVAAYPKR